MGARSLLWLQHVQDCRSTGVFCSGRTERCHVLDWTSLSTFSLSVAISLNLWKSWQKYCLTVQRKACLLSIHFLTWGIVCVTMFAPCFSVTEAPPNVGEILCFYFFLDLYASVLPACHSQHSLSKSGRSRGCRNVIKQHNYKDSVLKKYVHSRYHQPEQHNGGTFSFPWTAAGQ